MRAVAFALSLLVLGSFGAEAQQARPTPSSGFLQNARDVAAVGAGALLGFLVAEPLGISELLGSVAGITVGTWWYADQKEREERRLEIRQMAAAREAVAHQGETPTLVRIR